MKFKPLRENVLLRRLEAAEEKIGSIIVPDTAKEKPMTAEVIEVGAGKVLKDGGRQAPEVKPGQTRADRKVLRIRGQARRRGLHHRPRGRDSGHRRVDGPH